VRDAAGGVFYGAEESGMMLGLFHRVPESCE